jgi:hypothetical protein
MLFIRKQEPGRRYARLGRGLDGCAGFFDRHETIDSLLKETAKIAVELFDSELCVITWLSEDNLAMRVRAGFSRNGLNGFNSQDPIAIRASSTSSTIDAACPPVILDDNHKHDQVQAAPLLVNKQIIGYLYVYRHGAMKPETASAYDRALNAFSKQVGYAIEVHQVRQMLASRYASSAMRRSLPAGSSDQDTLEVQILESVQHPEKVAKIIARSFYKDLRKAGFEPKQILVVASEIIENLNEAFRKTKEKTGDVGQEAKP